MSAETGGSASIIVEGRMAVEAMLRSGRFRVESIVVEEGRHRDVVAIAESQQLPVRQCSADAIRELAGFDFHRGIFARVERPAGEEAPMEFLHSATRLVLPLGIADPGNLGTIARSAAAFGAEAILTEKGRGADLWGRKAIRASATAVFRLPVYDVSDPVGFLIRARAAGMVTIGTSLGSGSVALRDAVVPERSLLLLGAEKDGLLPEVEEACDRLVRIPMANGMDSLNVAGTAAIVCHHFFAPGAS